MTQKINKNQEFSAEFMAKLNGTQLVEVFEQFLMGVQKDRRQPSSSYPNYFERQTRAALKKAADELDLNRNANSMSGPLQNKNVAVGSLPLEQFFVKTTTVMPPGEMGRHERFCINPGRTHCKVCKGTGRAAYLKQEKIAVKQAKEDLSDQLAKLKALAAAHLATFENE